MIALEQVRKRMSIRPTAKFVDSLHYVPVPLPQVQSAIVADTTFASPPKLSNLFQSYEDSMRDGLIIAPKRGAYWNLQVYLFVPDESGAWDATLSDDDTLRASRVELRFIFPESDSADSPEITFRDGQGTSLFVLSSGMNGGITARAILVRRGGLWKLFTVRYSFS